MDDARAHHLVDAGRKAIDREDFQTALKLLSEALSLDPTSSDGHALLSTALLGLKRPYGALVEAKEAVALDAENAYAHVAMGFVLLHEKQPAKAKEHFDAARALDPSSATALRGLALACAMRGDERGRREHLGEAQKLEPENVSVLVDLADAHADVGQHDAAREIVDAALAIDPSDRRALVVKGHLLLRAGDVAGARDHCAWALRQDATSHGAIHLLVAIKARESFWLGAWFRVNAWVAEREASTSTLILIVSFLVVNVLRLVLEDLDLALAALVVRYLWLAICRYSYAAPAFFQRMVKKEIERVVLDPDY